MAENSKEHSESTFSGQICEACTEKTKNDGFDRLICLVGSPNGNDSSIKALIDSLLPATILSTDLKGRMAIHFLCRYNGHCHASLAALLSKAPSCASAEYPGQPGLLPLHILCRYYNPACLQAVNLLLDYFPAAAEMAGPSGCTPLHYVCASSAANLPVVTRLLSAAPSAPSRADSEGFLPLHYAAGSWADAGLLERLKRAFPPAVCAAARGGETAVDAVVRNPAATDALLRALLDPP